MTKKNSTKVLYLKKGDYFQFIPEDWEYSCQIEDRPRVFRAKEDMVLRDHVLPSANLDKFFKDNYPDLEEIPTVVTVNPGSYDPCLVDDCTNIADSAKTPPEGFDWDKIAEGFINIQGTKVYVLNTFVHEATTMTRKEFSDFIRDKVFDVGHPVSVYELNAQLDVTLEKLVALRKTEKRKFKLGRAIHAVQKHLPYIRAKCRKSNLAWKYFVNEWEVKTTNWADIQLRNAHDPELAAILIGSVDFDKGGDWVLNPPHIVAKSAISGKVIDVMVNQLEGTCYPLGAYDYTIEAMRANTVWQRGQ